MSTRHGSGNEPAASFFDRPVIAATRSQGRVAYCLSNTLVRQTVTTSPFQTMGGQGQMTLVVRTTVNPATLATAVQREARAFDPVIPMFQAETLAAQLDDSLGQERLVAKLSSVFGLLALLLPKSASPENFNFR